LIEIVLLYNVIGNHQKIFINTCHSPKHNRHAIYLISYITKYVFVQLVYHNVKRKK